MNNRQSRRVASGFLIMAAALGFALGVFFLADLRTALQKRYTLYAVLPTAPRLRVGSPVWIGGHRVGQVKTIGFRRVLADSGPTIAVQLSLPREVQPLVRRGSLVRLTSARLVGEPAVDIVPGDPGEPLALEGDTLFPLTLTGRAQALDSFRHFQRSLDSLLVATRSLSPLVETRKAQFVLLAEQIAGLQTAFSSLRQRLANGSADRLLSDPALQNALASISTTVQQLGPAFQGAASRYSDPVLRQAFGTLQLRAASLSTQLQRVREQFAHSSLLRFSQDSSLARSLHQAQVELDSLMAETRRNPLRFWLGDRRRGVKEPLKQEQ